MGWGLQGKILERHHRINSSKRRSTGRTGTAQAKIDAGQQRVAETQTEIDAWWNGLTPPQQNNPVNKAKYETANSALTARSAIF